MIPQLTANLIVLLHFAFIIFVLCGGLLVLRWKKLLWLHLPAVIWGMLIEFSGWGCPLTPLENRMRMMAGETGYPGGFIERHLLPVIYPMELTQELQFALGASLLLINLLIYGVIIVGRKKARDGRGEPQDKESPH